MDFGSKNAPSAGSGTVSRLAAALAFAALAWLAIEAAVMVRQAREQMGGLRGMVELELSDFREMLRAELTATRVMVDGRLAGSQRLLAAESLEARSLVGAESAAWRAEVAVTREESLKRLDVATEKMDAIEGATISLLDEYRRLPAIVGGRLDVWTDCRGNGACWQAQATALLGAARVTAGETSRTMRTVREATPEIVKNVDLTTANVARLTKPDSLKWRILKLAAPPASGAIFGAIK